MAYFRPSVIEDCDELAPIMKAPDVREVMASTGMPPLTVLRGCFHASEECLTVINDEDEVVAMFGYSILAEDVAAPWFLSSGGEIVFAKKFLREGRKWVQAVNSQFPLLTNFVDVRNKVAQDWLKFLGFSFLRVIPYGVERKPFIEFVRIKNV